MHFMIATCRGSAGGEGRPRGADQLESPVCQQLLHKLPGDSDGEETQDEWSRCRRQV
jgi:hypothetical protein